MGRGKYYLEIKACQYFDSAEEREHWIKNHSELPYDDITELLKDYVVEHELDEGSVVTLSLKRLNGGTK